jgi:hypothetical protein
MLPLMPAQINKLDSFSHGLDDATSNGFRLTGYGDDGPVVRPIHLAVEQRRSGKRRQSSCESIDNFLPPPLTEIRNALQDFSHVLSSRFITTLPFLMATRQ